MASIKQSFVAWLFHFVWTGCIVAPLVLVGLAGYSEIAIPFAAVLAATSFISKPRNTSMRFELLSRMLFLTLSAIGAYLSMNGTFGYEELMLLSGCIALNEARHRMGMERSNTLMTGFWISLFVMAPLLYLAFSREPIDLANLSDPQFLPMVVVATALPFQVFATYVPELPRAQHLILAFVLVETLLAARQRFLQEHWAFIILIFGLFVLCLTLSHIAVVLRRDARGGARSLWRTRILQQILRPSGIAVATPYFIAVCLLIVAGFLVLAPAYSQEVEDRIRSNALLPQQPRGPSPSMLDDPFENDDPGRRNPSARSDDSTTGVAETLKLNDIGKLLPNPHVVARAYLRAEPESKDSPEVLKELEQPYLRSMTLADFDGINWVHYRTNRSLLMAPRELPEFWPEYPKEVAGDIRVRLEFDLPDTTTQLVLATPGPVRRVPFLLDPEYSVWMTPEQVKLDPGSERLVWPNTEARAIGGYELIASLPSSAAAGGSATSNDDVPDAYLALPTGFKEALEERLSDFKIWQNMRRAEADNMILARAVERWFSQEDLFRYSLELRPVGESPVLDFICNPTSRVGHCEYFASAMAAVLRALDVPSRVAVGWALSEEEGEQRPTDKSYVIRNSDAHAWVEVFDNRRGVWSRFDPTPAQERADERNNTLMNESQPPKPEELSKLEIKKKEDPSLLDQLSSWVLGYNSQSSRKLRENAGSYVESFFVWLKTYGFWILGGFGAVVIVLLVLKRIRAKRKPAKRSESITASPRAAYVSLYNRLLESLARLNLKRKPTQTPMEFAREVIAEFGNDFEILRSATDIYYAIRFSSSTGEASMTNLDQSLMELKALAERTHRKILGQHQDGLMDGGA